MKPSEAIGYGILAVIGVFALKLMGGISGLKDIFKGIWSWDDGQPDQGKTPEEILTETKTLEEMYAQLSKEAQELAQAKLSIEQVKTGLQTDVGFQYLQWMKPFLSVVPFVGEMIPTTERAVYSGLGAAERGQTLRYMSETQRRTVARRPNVKILAHPDIPARESLHMQPYLIETKQGVSIVRYRGR